MSSAPPTPTPTPVRTWTAPFADATVALGDWSLFAARVFSGVLGRAFRLRDLLRLCVEVGSNSVGVIAITGAFIGMVPNALPLSTRSLPFRSILLTVMSSPPSEL